MPVASADTISDVNPCWDAIVVGGGFYGCSIALELRTRYGLDRVLLVEREGELMTRASYGNQARVHNGYHYPRSFTTAFRSRINFSRFVEKYRACIFDDFKMLYCVGSQNSLVTRYQFEKFCNDIGAEVRPADESLQVLFNPELIESVYEVTEYAFDATSLARTVRQDLDAAGVHLLLGATVQTVSSADGGLAVSCVSRGNESDTGELRAGRVFNCTYAGLNALVPDKWTIGALLKYEIAEIALVSVPEPMARLGVTVMDGPFFSCMPFPATGHHSLTHVRYTPHFAWLDTDEANVHPYDILSAKAPHSRARYMIGDAARYMPLMGEVRHERSLFEVKTVLLRNEVDDGRPILFHHHEELQGMYSILGGKIDNIFDVKEVLRSVMGTDGPV